MLSVSQNTGTSLIETFTIEQIRAHVQQARLACCADRRNLRLFSVYLPLPAGEAGLNHVLISH